MDAHAGFRPRALASLIGALGLMWGATSAAVEWRPAGWFVEGGQSARDTRTVGVGAHWPWAWQRPFWGGQVGGATEVFLSHWSVDRTGGRESRLQLVVMPLVRYRFSEGRSPWFVEGGIGLSLNDSHYATRDAQMSTRWNFHDVLAVGRSFGAQERHELSLRLVHISNGSLKKPNPGDDFLKLRYLVRF